MDAQYETTHVQDSLLMATAWQPEWEVKTLLNLTARDGSASAEAHRCPHSNSLLATERMM